MTRTTSALRASAALATLAVAASLVAVAPATAAGSNPSTAAAAATTPSRNKPETTYPWMTPAARDRVGYRASAYTGRYYDPDFEGFRLCIVQREAGGQYGVVSWGGPWRGAYQFSTAWKYEIVDRLSGEMRRAYGGDVWSRLKDRLLSREINEWNRYWQDAGFWAIFDKGSNASPWQGGNWYCDPSRGAGLNRWPSASHWNYLDFEGPRPERASTRSGAARLAQAAPGDRGNDEASRLGRSPYRFGSVAYSKWCAREWMRLKYGWRERQWPALNKMWWRESNWLFDERSTTGIYIGIPQTTAGVVNGYGYGVSEYKRDPLIQVIVGLRYIKERYGTPLKAWNFWQRHNWY